MAEVRSCVFVLLLFLTLKNVAPKPFFGLLWCDIFCDDDDDEPTSSEDYDLCFGCNPRRRTTTTTIAPITGNNPSMQFMIPPGDGFNATLTRNGQSFLLNIVPWLGQAGVTPVPSAANPAPPAATTAPPAATPAPAAAEATTAAATTAATTAAAGK